MQSNGIGEILKDGVYMIGEQPRDLADRSPSQSDINPTMSYHSEYSTSGGNGTYHSSILSNCLFGPNLRLLFELGFFHLDVF